jgi:hypothetical protein
LRITIPALDASASSRPNAPRTGRNRPFRNSLIGDVAFDQHNVPTGLAVDLLEPAIGQIDDARVPASIEKVTRNRLANTLRAPR